VDKSTWGLQYLEAWVARRRLRSDLNLMELGVTAGFAARKYGQWVEVRAKLDDGGGRSPTKLSESSPVEDKVAHAANRSANSRKASQAFRQMMTSAIVRSF